jgi:hypothetical protein
MMAKLLEDTDAEYVAVIFDAGRRTFRNDIYPEYKAQRPDPPDDLVPQFALIRDAVRAFNLACVEAPGFEADDLIATYAKAAAAQGAEVTILSSDKDLMQLVGGPVMMQDPIKGNRIGRSRGALRRATGEGDPGPGSGRRFDRQRAGCSRHRRQDRGRADQDLRRSRHAARARIRDQAAEAS